MKKKMRKIVRFSVFFSAKIIENSTKFNSNNSNRLFGRKLNFFTTEKPKKIFVWKNKSVRKKNVFSIETKRFVFLRLKVELEEELKKIVEQNKNEIDKLNEQFENLKINLPSYESLLSNSKESNVHLYSEIQTYQSLLSNVWSDCRVEQRSAFQVFRNDQFIWIRI